MSRNRSPKGASSSANVQYVPVVIPMAPGGRPPSQSVIASAIKAAKMQDTTRGRFVRAPVAHETSVSPGRRQKREQPKTVQKPVGGGRKKRGGDAALKRSGDASAAKQGKGVTSSPGKGRRGGALASKRKKAGSSETFTAEKLNDALDMYMGEDVRKARLDAELDNYFVGGDASGNSGGVMISGEGSGQPMDDGTVTASS